MLIGSNIRQHTRRQRYLVATTLSTQRRMHQTTSSPKAQGQRQNKQKPTSTCSDSETDSNTLFAPAAPTLLWLRLRSLRYFLQPLLDFGLRGDRFFALAGRVKVTFRSSKPAREIAPLSLMALCDRSRDSVGRLRRFVPNSCMYTTIVSHPRTQKLPSSRRLVLVLVCATHCEHWHGHSQRHATRVQCTPKTKRTCNAPASRCAPLFPISLCDKSKLRN